MKASAKKTIKECKLLRGDVKMQVLVFATVRGGLQTAHIYHLHKSRSCVVPYTSLDLLGPLAGGDVTKWVKLTISSSCDLLRQSRWSGGTFSVDQGQFR